MSDHDPSPLYPSLEASRKILRDAPAEAFDGHTAFKDMTLEQRIQWASLSALAVYRAREERNREEVEDG